MPTTARNGPGTRGSAAEGAREAPALAVLVLLTALGGSCNRGDARPEVSARSVVVFLVDTLRADHLGCYGYHRNTSPRIDAFAREGILFESCLAQSSWTKPATASVLTGQYPSVHGAVSSGAALSSGVTTLAERLSTAGLATGAFVTNHWVANKKAGMRRGFDHFVPYPVEDPVLRYQRAERPVGDALDWIRARGDEPFFCYVHVLDPHAPYSPPPPHDRRFGADYAGTVDGGYALGADDHESLHDLSAEDVQHLVDLYDGEIAYVDEQFGRLLDGLEEAGRLQDTLVVFLADHGEEFGDHGGWRHNSRLLREVVHVPLICRLPGAPAEGRGRTHAGLSMQIDVAPTVLDVLGLPPDSDLPGTSLLDRAFGGRAGAPFGFSEVDYEGITRTAVVGEDYKLIRQSAPTERELLFDLDEDPGEHRDVSALRPEEAGLYRTVLDGFLADVAAGYSLLVHNLGETPLEVRVSLTTAAPMQRVYVQREDLHQSSRIEQRAARRKPDRGWVTRARFRVVPGDADGILFEPAEDEAGVTVEVRIDGRRVPPGAVTIGLADPAPPHPPAVPFALDPSAEWSVGAAAPVQGAPGAPYAVTVSRNRGPATETIELSEEEQAALRALGYLGEEE